MAATPVLRSTTFLHAHLGTEVDAKLTASPGVIQLNFDGGPSSPVDVTLFLDSATASSVVSVLTGAVAELKAETR